MPGRVTEKTTCAGGSIHMALGREAGVGADGANHGVGGNAGVFGVFHDVVERRAQIHSALFIDTHRVGVTVDGTLAAQFIGRGNPSGWCQWTNSSSMASRSG